ncbi:NADH-quinone oxidoreductase subunit NuoN [Bacillus alkalicellulosilyticus]|uniref:NADH-quinone oxidoreductase subunit NuoN n=1 Tax=Alkalihalobacterium alkalicellulosilyticum TaxID=1912214 RepID=UPI000996BC10|nr:NADH-quinone oxidoreductase subunit NuoN [Bacillus alkalicellulosilyticus]
MDLETLLSFPWGIMAPEFTILIVATVLSLLDLFLKEKIDRKLLGWLALGGILVALVFLVRQLGSPVQMILYDTYRLDGFSIAFKFILLIGAALVMIMAIDYKKKEIEYRGEFFYLLLTALLGGMIMSSSADLITLFVGLELLSLSSYILAGIMKKDLQSNEAAMKYVINGGIATAITLFGLSYIYGLTGFTNLFEIAQTLADPNVLENAFLLYFAFFLVFVGLVFKIAAAPFHMWAPDVYQGSPTPVAAFLSVVSKTAGFAIILRLLFVIFSATPGLQYSYLVFDTSMYVVAIAIVTMIVGNIMALRQENVKRMFAYSSIAQAGYILVPIATLNMLMYETLWFYLVAYLFMNIGAFAVLQLVTEQTNSSNISSFAGLGKKSPILALLMGLFLISLAGIPISAGFIGKYYIFIGAISVGFYWTAGIMIATSIISYFYYFRVLGQMYFRPNYDSKPITVPIGMYVVLFICAIGTFGLGLFPNVLIDFMNTYLDFSQILQ